MLSIDLGHSPGFALVANLALFSMFGAFGDPDQARAAHPSSIPGPQRLSASVSCFKCSPTCLIVSRILVSRGKHGLDGLTQYGLRAQSSGCALSTLVHIRYLSLQRLCSSTQGASRATHARGSLATSGDGRLSSASRSRSAELLSWTPSQNVHEIWLTQHMFHTESALRP
jgi:hypothetical protein